MNRSALLIAAMAIALGGCSSTDTKKTADAQTAEPDDKVYVTGSRIPRKAKDAGAASVKSAEGQDAQDTLKNIAPMYVPPSGGGGR